MPDCWVIGTPYIDETTGELKYRAEVEATVTIPCEDFSSIPAIAYIFPSITAPPCPFATQLQQDIFDELVAEVSGQTFSLPLINPGPSQIQWSYNVVNPGCILGTNMSLTVIPITACAIQSAFFRVAKVPTVNPNCQIMTGTTTTTQVPELPTSLPVDFTANIGSAVCTVNTNVAVVPQ